MKTIWSPISITRIQEISEYISNDSPSEALNWVNKIFDYVLELEKFPAMGRQVPEIKKNNYKELILGNYRIIYRIDEKQINILTVRHVKQILPINEIKRKEKKSNE